MVNSGRVVLKSNRKAQIWERYSRHSLRTRKKKSKMVYQNTPKNLRKNKVSIPKKLTNNGFLLHLKTKANIFFVSGWFPKLEEKKLNEGQIKGRYVPKVCKLKKAGKKIMGVCSIQILPDFRLRIPKILIFVLKTY